MSYKYRVHDPRIGRFLSLDPLAPEYPWNSPYAFSENRVIDMVELEGAEGLEDELVDKAKRYGINLVKKATGYFLQKMYETVVYKAEKKTEEMVEESEDPKTVSAGLTMEFIFGIGPEERSFGPGHPFTISLKDSNLTTQALKAFYEGYEDYLAGEREEVPSRYRVDFSPFLGMGDTGPIREFLADGKFTAAQFTGTAMFHFNLVEEESGDSWLEVEVFDTKNEYSFLYHVSGSDRHSRAERSVMGETFQYYFFTIPIEQVKNRVENDSSTPDAPNTFLEIRTTE